MLAQRKFKTKSSFGTIADGDGASMKLHGMFDYGKSETGAAFLARASFIYAIETFKKVRQMFLHNAPAVVFESDATRLLSVFKQRNINILPFRIGNGIFRKVAEDGGNKRKVALDGDDVLKIYVKI